MSFQSVNLGSLRRFSDKTGEVELLGIIARVGECRECRRCGLQRGGKERGDEDVAGPESISAEGLFRGGEGKWVRDLRAVPDGHQEKDTRLANISLN